MSALGLDDVNDPRGVLAYAPRKSRPADDESSIRPVLERLSRSEGRVPGPRLVPKSDVQDVVQPQVETVARSAFPMTARLAVAVGVLALVGAAGAGYFAQPSAADHAVEALTTTGSAPSAMPKPVQTTSIQRPADAAPAARIVKDDARVPQPAPAAAPQTQVADAAPAAAALPPAANDPSVSPLTTWSAASAEGSGWSTPTTPPEPPAGATKRAAVEEPAASTPSAKPEAREPAHKAAKTHRARHRVSHQRRHRNARAQASARQADPSAQPESQAEQAQPAKKLPLQAAIDRIFGNSGTAAAPPAQQ